MSRNTYAKPSGWYSVLNQMAKNRVLSKYLAELGRKGGKARTNQMTPAERKQLARKAAQARWAKKTKKQGLQND
jgi:phage gp16-like protein